MGIGRIIHQLAGVVDSTYLLTIQLTSKSLSSPNLSLKSPKVNWDLGFAFNAVGNHPTHFMLACLWLLDPFSPCLWCWVNHYFQFSLCSLSPVTTYSSSTAELSCHSQSYFSDFEQKWKVFQLKYKTNSGKKWTNTKKNENNLCSNDLVWISRGKRLDNKLAGHRSPVAWSRNL